MPETSKENRSQDEAKEDARVAIDGGATKITLQRKADNGNWDIRITIPDPAGPGV